MVVTFIFLLAETLNPAFMPRSLLSIDDLSKTEVMEVFNQADELRNAEPGPDSIQPVIGSLLFFEKSTRTRLGFEAAAWRLGVKTLVMYETKVNGTMSAAESLPDTIRTLDAFSSFYCIRHPDSDVFDEVTPYTKQPVINSGNGYDEHPTQALIDGYTMWHRFGEIDGLSVSFVGQLKYSRAAHSLLRLLSKFSDVSVKEFAPQQLQVEGYTEGLTANGNTFSSHEQPEWGTEDIVYVTGFPPKNPDGEFPQELRDRYKVTEETVNSLRPEAVILNPLPRIDEIAQEVDDLPNAHYFMQNKLGLFVRMAVIQTFCLES